MSQFNQRNGCGKFKRTALLEYAALKAAEMLLVLRRLVFDVLPCFNNLAAVGSGAVNNTVLFAATVPKMPRSSKKTVKRKPSKVSAKTSNNKKKTKKKKNKANYIIYYILLFLTALVIVIVLSVTVLFPVEKVSIDGESEYTAEKIESVAAVEYGKNLIRYDTDVMEKAIFDELHALDSVKVRKRLPGTLVIETVGATRIAAVSEGGKYYIISKSGRIAEESETPGDFPVVLGFEVLEPSQGNYIESSNEKKPDLMYELLNEIAFLGVEGIETVDISDHLNIILNYLGRIDVVIGPPSDLTLKLSTAKGLLESHIEANAQGTLWVTNPQTARFRPYIADEYLPPVRVVAADSSGEPEDENLLSA